MNKEKVLKAFLFPQFHYAGKFLSKAGRLMAIYPDIRLLSSFPKKVRVVEELLVKTIKKNYPRFDLIASPAIAGIPWGFAAAMMLNKRFCYLRTEAKQIQLKKRLEGYYQKGDRVMVIDDGMSSSKTKQEIISYLEKQGLKVVGVIVVFDALSGKKMDKKFSVGLRWLKKYHYTYLVNWQEVIGFYKSKKFWRPEFCDLVIEMIQNFSSWSDQPQNWQKFKQLALPEKNLILDKSFMHI